MNTEQTHIAVKLALDIAGYSDPETLAFIECEGEEQLNDLYHFDIKFISTHFFSKQELLYKTAKLSLTAGTEQRFVNGLIVSFAAQLHADARGFYHYRITIVPKLWQLTQVKHNKIYQNQTRLKIIKTLLDNHEVCYAPLPILDDSQQQQVVQYDETDYQFLQRLLKQLNLCFYFDFIDNNHILNLVKDDVVFNKLDYDESYLLTWQVVTNARLNKPSKLQQWQSQEVKLASVMLALQPGRSYQQYKVDRVQHVIDTKHYYHNQAILKAKQYAYQNSIKPYQTAFAEQQRAMVAASHQNKLTVHFNWQESAVDFTDVSPTQAAIGVGLTNQFYVDSTQSVVTMPIEGEINSVLSIGVLPDLENTPFVYDLKQEAHQRYGWRTANGHELCFDDTDNAENILLQSKSALNLYSTQQLNLSSNNNILHSVKANYDITTNAGQCQLQAGKILLQVGGSYISLSASGIEIKAGKVNINIPGLSQPGGMARVGDHHKCAKITNILPHIGGPVTKGSKVVFVNGKAAARLGDPMHCAVSTDHVKTGANRFLIDGRPAAMLHSHSAHGGKIKKASKDVMLSSG